MAPWLNFLIPFGSTLIGIILWVIVGGWWGLPLFLLCFIVGSIIGTRVFKALATPEQIREDLKARLHND